MFGKKSSDSLLNQSGRSFVAETMQIEGDFHYSGAVDVAGLINGNVYGKEMIILDTGSVKGNLYVSKLNINGHVEGQIVTDEISLGSNSVNICDSAVKLCCSTVVWLKSLNFNLRPWRTILRPVTFAKRCINLG